MTQIQSNIPDSPPKTLDALAVILSAQAEEAATIPVKPVGKVRRGNRRPPKVVDLTLHHYANHGLSDNARKASEKANREYKAEERKVREGVFKYNYEGIAKHGIAWNHMNRKQREARFKELLMSDNKMPKEVIAWAKERGMM